MFGLLDEKWVCVGSIVLKRKQGLSDEQAADCPGTVVDLIPRKLEAYAMSLMLKRLREASDKQVYFCADHDMTVIIVCHQHLKIVTNISKLSPTSQNCHQHIRTRTFCHQHQFSCTSSYKHFFIQ